MSILAFIDLDKDFTRVERKALTPLQKRGVYVNYDCRCAGCGMRFNGLKSVFCFDHTHALCLGGGNEEGNYRPLCRDCTLEKNRADARALKKAREMEAERLAAPPTIARLKQPREKRPTKSGRTIRNRSGFQNRPSRLAASRGFHGEFSCV